MSASSKIEWTEATWNPTTGCEKISPGCAHCYAERFAERWRGIPGHSYEQGFDLKIWPERLDMPSRWKKPRLIFVNSMSDLFHPDVPDTFIREVFEVMRNADWHKFQVLTKRPERMLKISEQLGEFPTNVWAGVSVESQSWLWRVEILKNIQASIKFLSCEPLLGPLKLSLDDIDWVIAGGESGGGARTMEIQWVRDIREQCIESKVPFFFKQWGGFNKKKNGRELDGRTWDEFPNSYVP